MYSSLLQHIQRFVSLTEEEKDILSSQLLLKKLNKKENVLEEGQVCAANYFIAKGCLRLYYINDKGTEQIVQFGIENWWITDFISLEKQLPSCFYLQAIESSTVIALEKSLQEDLFEKIPKLERYFRLVTQKAYGAAQLRIKYIFDLSGEERYDQFTRLFPDFVQRIPQYMLASYLGFTPEFLSTLRAKKR